MLTALVIWIQVASSSLLTRDVDMPLELIGLADEATLAGNAWPEVVRVRATGSKWQFFQNRYLGRGLGRVAVDLSNVTTGVRWQRDVTVNDVVSSLADVSIQPPVRLTLLLDRLGEKIVAVKVVYVGTLPEHRIMLGPVTSEPDSVVVRGPSRVLDGMGDEIVTEPVDLSRIRGRQTVGRALVAPGEDIVVEPVEVQLTFSVLEAGRRVYENVPIVPLVDVDQTGADVFPPVASVEVRGPAEELSRMPMSSISLTVALTGLGAGTHTLAPEALLPERFELMSMEPEQVLVIIGGKNTRGPEGQP